jgi:uncharacterized protein (DUF362 family)
MSFVLDPPALLVLGAVLYYIGRRFNLARLVLWVLGIGIIALFISTSSALYLDILRWHIPGIMDMPGSVWMFHSDVTGIQKPDVPVAAVAAMFALYPLWLYLGYLAAQYLLRRTPIRRVYSYPDVRSRGRRGERAGVAVARDPDPRLCVRKVVADLGGMARFVKPGDRVVIKANICGGNPEKPGSYTSQGVVEEVAGLVRESGGEPTVVDADMVWTEFWPVAHEEGWTGWSAEKKIPLVNLSETVLVQFDFGEGNPLRTTPVSWTMLDADVIISIPVMKTHLLTGVTLGMKNMYGTFPEMDKAKFHGYGIEDVVVSINRAFLPTLTIIDGSIGGEANGPLSSEPVHFQTIIASGDVVAADGVACRLMGYDPREVIHVRKGHETGLGSIVDFDLSRLPYPHPRDGAWKRPSITVTKYYEQVLEALLTLPGMDTFFNLAADFVLYDTATLPIFRDITPEVEVVIHDIVYRVRQGFTGTTWDLS